MNQLDVAIIKHVQVGWRLVYRDENMAQLVSPKTTYLPFAAVCLSLFNIFLVFLSATLAVGFAAICSWLYLLGVANWLSSKENACLLNCENNVVTVITEKKRGIF